MYHVYCEPKCFHWIMDLGGGGGMVMGDLILCLYSFLTYFFGAIYNFSSSVCKPNAYKALSIFKAGCFLCVIVSSGLQNFAPD